MKNSTPLASASSAPTKTYEKVVGKAAGTATSRARCQVFTFEHYTPSKSPAPAQHSSIGDLISEWEQDASGRAALVKGRQWVANSFYAEDGDTVRTLRLRKGWSQTQLADALSTSQSHVARIERGTENVTIETCRKLSNALGIDLNTLDQALKRQESIAQAKQK